MSKAAEGLFSVNLRFVTIPPSRRCRATSLCTREAYHHPTVHLKGVTHYTLQGKVCEKEYEQNARTPFDFSADKTCFMEGTPSAGLFVVCRAVQFVKNEAVLFTFL